MKKVLILSLVALMTVFMSTLAFADGHMKSKTIDIYELVADKADGMGKKLGTITIVETPYGLVFDPNVKGLSSGEHGFHIHANPAIGPVEKDGKMVAGLQAGGHYDPGKTGKHLGPTNPEGHLGDLPKLYVDKDGNTPFAVLAPRLKTLSDVMNRSIMIHVHGDNYSDNPAALGGGGPRMAAGVIK